MKCTLVLTSVTYAHKAARILAAEGMRAYPVKTPEVTNVRGCGYGVEFEGDCDTAAALLERSGVKVVGAAGGRKA